MTSPKKQTIFAPAKINLFLHVIKRLRNGYHKIDSLVTFADIGDVITIEEADRFSFNITGAFSSSFEGHDQTHFLDSDNLVVKAARALSQITDKKLNTAITLEKNLPVASGIGGGSSDAAATLWGLQDFFDLDRRAPYLPELLKQLGADVPMCYYCQPAHVSGIGEIVAPVSEMPEVAVVLVNPMKTCSTPDVFLHYNAYQSTPVITDFSDRFETIDDLIMMLKSCRNDLYLPARTLIPEIENVINALDRQDSCLFSRMSGSGATCFGLFKNSNDAEAACAAIQDDNPDWWVQAGWINRLERY